MTRLRYIVDRPRGPRGGNHDEPYAFRNRESAERAAEPLAGRRFRPAGTVFEIDLDALQPIGASLEEQFAWHERQALHHETEMLRLRPHAEAKQAPALTTSDMARIREAVAAWDAEELRRGGVRGPAQQSAAIPPGPLARATRLALLLLRDLWREGKLG